MPPPETPADVDDVAHPLDGPGRPRPVLVPIDAERLTFAGIAGRCAP